CPGDPARDRLGLTRRRLCTTSPSASTGRISRRLGATSVISELSSRRQTTGSRSPFTSLIRMVTGSRSRLTMFELAPCRLSPEMRSEVRPLAGEDKRRDYEDSQEQRCRCKSSKHGPKPSISNLPHYR